MIDLKISNAPESQYPMEAQKLRGGDGDNHNNGLFLGRSKNILLSIGVVYC